MKTASIIIPTYNHADYLQDAVDSVLAQTRTDVEIIVIDDGSTDDTREVAAGFGDSIRYIYQENRGLSAARNAGIARASGRYFTVLDADDMLEPDYVALMVNALESAPDAGGVYCSFRTVDEDSRPLFQKGHSGVPPVELHERLIDGNFIVPPCMLVKQEVYAAVGSFDESLTACEDWDMWLRIARGHKIIPLNAVLVRYRVLAGSMSGDPQRMLTNRLAVLDKERPFLSDAEYQRVVAYAYRTAAFEWLQANDETRALDTLKHAALHYPLLLTELETFYELALWNQPKGWRGDLRKIDVQRNRARMMELLNRLFALPDLPDKSSAFRNIASARAYEALALLSYGRRDMKHARAYFRRSLALAPSQISEPGFAATMLKAFINAPLWRTGGEAS